MDLVLYNDSGVPASRVKELLAYAVGSPTEERLEQLLADVYAQRDTSLYLLLDGSEVVGLVGLRHQSPGSVTILHIAVDASRRHQGLGRMMLEHIAAVEKISALVAETDAEAVSFYRHCGFDVQSLGEKYPGVERFLCTLKLRDRRLMRMHFSFVPMTPDFCREIQQWKYTTGFFKDIWVQPYLDTYDPITGKCSGPCACDGYAVLDEKQELAGIFEYYFQDWTMEIGLALRPDLTGKGLGASFIQQGIDFGIKHYDYQQSYIKLTVSVGNTPALHVYQRLGFTVVAERTDKATGEVSYEMRLVINK